MIINHILTLSCLVKRKSILFHLGYKRSFLALAVIWHEFGVKTVALVKFNKRSLIPRVALEKMLGKDN